MDRAVFLIAIFLFSSAVIANETGTKNETTPSLTAILNENSSKSVPSAEVSDETKTSESALTSAPVKENKDGDVSKSTTSESKNPQNVRDVTEPVKSTETVAPTISKTESNSVSASAATTTTTTTTTTTATPHHSSPGNAGAPIQMSLFAMLPAIIVLVHQFY